MKHSWKFWSSKTSPNPQTGEQYTDENHRPLLKSQVLLDERGHVITELACEAKNKVVDIIYSALKSKKYELMDNLCDDGLIEFDQRNDVC